MRLQLEALTPRLKPNPRARKTGAPMKLYEQEQVEALAVSKFGTLEAVEAERERRMAARELRAEAKLQRMSFYFPPRAHACCVNIYMPGRV